MFLSRFRQLLPRVVQGRLSSFEWSHQGSDLPLQPTPTASAILGGVEAGDDYTSHPSFFCSFSFPKNIYTPYLNQYNNYPVLPPKLASPFHGQATQQPAGPALHQQNVQLYLLSTFHFPLSPDTARTIVYLVGGMGEESVGW